MKLPDKPAACAIRLTQLLQAVQNIHGTNFYPLKVDEIAVQISQQFFPDSPLTKIQGESFSDDFEGMLTRIPRTKNEWGIVYNKDIKSRGRINFTLAHELGHYLLHRLALEEEAIKCSRYDMLRWDSAEGQREAEANEFASYLLMPRNTFESLMQGQKPDLHLFQHIADHFDVSLTAAILKWIGFTSTRAMLVVARDGFVRWARSSDSLFKSGVFLRYKQQTIELPARSLAARRDKGIDNQTGVLHEPNIWPFNEPVHESTLLAEHYDMTITLLIFGDRIPTRGFEDAPDEEDTYDRFMKTANLR